MPQNAVFLLKNYKNRQTLGVSPPDPHGLRPQNFVHVSRCEFIKYCTRLLVIISIRV